MNRVVEFSEKVLGSQFLLFAVAIVFITACRNDPESYYGAELDEYIAGSNAVNILLLGDTGTGEEGQQNVANSIINVHSVTSIDFAILLGDNFYDDGVSSISDPQWDSKFRDMYPATDLPFRFYAVLGNHDYHLNPDAQYEYTEPGADRWICEDYGYVLPVRLNDNFLIEIFFIDSEIIAEMGKQAFRIAEWLENRAKASNADYKILAAHRPLFSSSTYHGDSAVMQFFFIDDFEEGLLDLAVAGHDHNLELQSRSLDGDGIADELFIVSGAGSKVRDVNDGPYSDFTAGQLGFTVLHLSSAGPEINFYGLNGTRLFP
jgi:tartrate-resistant acid phosphatase type 5